MTVNEVTSLFAGIICLFLFIAWLVLWWIEDYLDERSKDRANRESTK
jgi:glucose-6-phosphate-specific signal transduction histidine kinase